MIEKFGFLRNWTQGRHYRYTIAGGFLLVIIVCISAAEDVRYGRTLALAESKRETELLAQVAAAQAASSIRYVSANLWRAGLSDRGVADQVSQPAPQGDVNLPPLSRIRIVECPRSVEAGMTGHAGAASGCEAYFKAMAVSVAPVSVSVVARQPAGTALEIVTRVAAESDGSERIVFADIDCEHLAGMFSGLPLGPETTVRVSLANAPQGQACVFPQRIQEVSDDLQRSSVAVPGYPLIVTLTTSSAQSIRAWHNSALRTLARTVSISAFVIVLLYVLLAQLRNQDRVNARLRTGEQRWRAVFDHAPVGIVLLPPNNAYLIANPAFQKMVGYSLDELQRLGPDDITHPDDVRLTRDQVAKLERRECENVQFEKRYVHRDGRIIWTEISISHLHDSGTLEGVLVAVVDDVTERRAAEQERQRLEAQLRQSQKLEALGTFAGGIAHDFNNILSAILGYGDRAFRALDSESPVRRHIEQVLNAGRRAQLLVERILAFSRSGMTARLPVHVAPLVEEAVDLLKAGLPSKVRIVVRINAAHAYIIGDATHLHQVVMNLCSNALHAMQGDGTLTVTVDEYNTSESQTLSLGTVPPGQYVRIRVEDTGAGIAPEVQERMFDPFFTTRKGGEGTGLGLSLVDGIVREYGGAIGVESEPGKGTRFDIYLPVTPERPALRNTQRREPPRGSGQCVLLVDDEKALVELGEELLAELGYEPAGYDSSIEAWRAFEANPDRFDAVLSDQTMPELTGIALIEKMRRMRPGLPAVLMSGYSTVQLEHDAQVSGISAILRKPIDRDELALAIRAALRM